MLDVGGGFGVDGFKNRSGLMTPANAYTVSDGQLVLTLQSAEEGGYVVTSPMDPELITEAETLDEAFENARDAAEALRQARQKLIGQLSEAEES
jgi:predicted RNase H-like HicB family nuclease